MWLLDHLAPDFKTIADFRKENTKAIRLVCREFVMVYRKLNLFSEAFVAIDGSTDNTATPETEEKQEDSSGYNNIFAPTNLEEQVGSDKKE